MEKTIFTRAHEYLDRIGLEYEVVPAACNIQAETYKFADNESALGGLSELANMVSDWGTDYVRLSLEITPLHSFVTLEDGEEEWDYGEEEEMDEWFSNLESRDLERIFPDVFDRIMASADPECCTVNDFIEEVDEMWDRYDCVQKYEIYQHFKN